MALHHFIPQDRLRALMRAEALPERCTGAVLFADISGFTALTESLRHSLGERRGIEALSQQVNAVYDALILEVERFGGSVIGFAGDAITCWFDAGRVNPAQHAARCAHAMQSSMAGFAGLSLKVGVAMGPARRLVVGHPDIQRVDALAGATVARAVAGESLAQPGEVLLDGACAGALGLPPLGVRHTDEGLAFLPLPSAATWPKFAAEPDADGGASHLPPPDADGLRSWVLPFVFQRETATQGLFVTDLRPATAVFMRFAGLDYDGDAQACNVLDDLVSRVQMTVQAHGGVMLELTIGDKGSYLYCNFGAAQAHEDDASRAVRAALSLQQLSRGASHSALQIGVSSGTMRVGGYGGATRQSFGAMGDDVNTAARLMQLARPGETLVSGRVRQVVGQEFTLEARPPMPMKGKAEPLPVFAVLGLQQARAIRLQEPATHLPMVGREVEVAALSEALAAALTGRGRVVSVQAEAGMGKSRLVAEGVRLARRSGFIGYGGACRMDGIRIPYLVWRNIWTAFFDLDVALPQRRQIRAIEAELHLHAPEFAEAWPLLGVVLGLEWPDNAFTLALQPKDRKALLETLLLRCLASGAREAAADGLGLLMVLEDLHAADPLSLDLLALVERAVESLPVLLLLSRRPSDADIVQPARIAPSPALAHRVQFELGALTAVQVEQVIRSKLAALHPERMGAVPAALVERIAARAQGNPFFVEELLNYLHDRGVDPRDVAAVQSLDLPASLHSLVLSRIDQLPVALQSTIKVASIIGRLFSVADLQGYYPPLGEPQAVAANVNELHRLDLTAPDPSAPEPSELFKHVVTHEAAYESLALATRTQLHGLYARHLEHRHADGSSLLAPQLAHHCLRAGLNDKALVYLRQAGEQAAARHANDEALDCFAQALRLLPAESVTERFDLLLRQEAVLALQSRHGDRRNVLVEMLALAERQPDPVQARAQVVVQQARLNIDTGDFSAARTWAQAGIDALKQVEVVSPGCAARLVDALHQAARAAYFAGEGSAAWPQVQRALSLSREHAYLRGEYNILSLMGLLHWHAGDFAAADDLLGQAVQLIDQVGDPRRQLDILNNLGVVAKARARLPQALAYYERAQAIARRIGDRSGEAMLLNNMGDACLEMGEYHRAGQYAAQAALIFEDVHETVSQGSALINRAEACRGLGQFPLARDLALQALALLRAGHHRHGEAVVLDNLAMVELALGRAEQAEESAQAAWRVALDSGLKALQPGILRNLGRAQTAQHRWPLARQTLLRAAEIAQDLSAPQVLLEVRAAQAELAWMATDEDLAQLACTALVEGLPLVLDGDRLNPAAFLPMWACLALHRALVWAQDDHAGRLLAAVQQELQRRLQRIPDDAARADFKAIPEHAIFLQASPP